MDKILEHIVIPPSQARAVTVRKGHVLRISQVEGGQVGDCVFYNAHDYKEMFHVGQTWALNVGLGLGTAKNFPNFYSKPPRENLMLVRIADTYGEHWGNIGARCSSRMLKMRDGLDNVPSCQENLTKALAPYGLTGDDIIDIFNVFMTADLHPDGGFTIRPTRAKPEDYIDLRAEMDILAAVSACPALKSATNGGVAKSLALTVYEAGA